MNQAHNNKILTFDEIAAMVRPLLRKYNAEYALLFGSYARGEATPDSDIDLLVVGGERFHRTDVLDIGEELRIISGKDTDVFELCEIDPNYPIYTNIFHDGVKIA